MLPARFPNLLVNGSQGIAVGMATNIPPHNLGEVIDAVVHLLDHPDATPDDLMRSSRARTSRPAALIMGRSGIIDAYRTGKGSIRVRARTDIVEGTGRQRDRIVVTEMPYQTSISATAVKIKELVESRQIEGIADVNDESAGGQTRLVIELKKDAPALVILNNLYKHTPLQTNFAVNTVALVDGVPRTLNLRAGAAGLHRPPGRGHPPAQPVPAGQGAARGPTSSRACSRPSTSSTRSSPSSGRPRTGPRPAPALMAEPFEFSPSQAEHILDMRLGQLTRLARIDLETELDELRGTIAELEAILADERRLFAVIKEELAEVQGALRRRAPLRDHLRRRRHRHRGPHRRRGARRHDVPAGLRQDGRRPTRSGPRAGAGGAWPAPSCATTTTSPTSSPRRPTPTCCSSPTGAGCTGSRPTRSRARTARPGARRSSTCCPCSPTRRSRRSSTPATTRRTAYLFFATRQGQVKKTQFNEYDSSLRSGLIAINLRDGDELVKVIPTNGGDDIFMVARSGMTIRFSEDDVRSMGRAAAGVRGMKLRQGDEVVSCDVVPRRRGAAAS